MIQFTVWDVSVYHLLIFKTLIRLESTKIRYQLANRVEFINRHKHWSQKTLWPSFRYKIEIRSVEVTFSRYWSSAKGKIKVRKSWTQPHPHLSSLWFLNNAIIWLTIFVLLYLYSLSLSVNFYSLSLKQHNQLQEHHK